MQTKSHSFLLAACAISPIVSLSLMAFTGVSLQLLFFTLVVPAAFIILIMSDSSKRLKLTIVRGWKIGLLAVLVYDLTRIPFIAAGWGDFIPKIGQWLLEDHSAPDWIGYVWRYVGNGGGLGIAFLMLRTSGIFRFRFAGLIYGVAVFACLMFTLLLSPNGQEQMFVISPLTFTGSFIGHVVFGLMLDVQLAAERKRKRSFIEAPLSEVSSGFEPL
jgi:hypothetical protein